MLRGWLIFVVFIGILSSGLSNCGAKMAAREASGGQDRTNTVASGQPDEDDDDSPVYQQTTAGALTLKREWDGHFYADTQINGTSIRMLVDTGATTIALSRDDARRAGLGISIGMPNVVGRGASGDVKGEYVTLDRISLGGESATKVSAIVLDGGEKSLLGQSFLSKFASVEIKGDTMVLR